MKRKVEVSTDMGKERENVECCRYHRPEPIGYQREEHRGTRSKQIDRKVSDVEARIFRRYKQV